MRLRLAVVLGLVLGLATGGEAQVQTRGAPTTLTAAVTVSNSALSIVTCTGGENKALLQVKTNAINFTLDSASATPGANDFLLNAGDWYFVDPITTFRWIRSGAADAVVKVQCFK